MRHKVFTKFNFTINIKKLVLMNLTYLNVGNFYKLIKVVLKLNDLYYILFFKYFN